jgi:hypothetical protein
MPMKIRPLAITEQRASELEILAELSAEQIATLRKKLEGRGENFTRHTDLLDIIRSEVEEKKADNLLRHVLSLRRFADFRKAPVADVVDALIAGLEKFGWPLEKLERISKNRADLIELMQLGIVHNSYKLADLYYDHPHHLHNIAILSEMRPAFDEARKSIGAMIIYSSLNIVYSDKSEDEVSLSIALKRDEIEHLRAECEKALQKLDVAERFCKTASVSAIQYESNSFKHR